LNYTDEQRLQTGIPGMDDILHGGLIAGNMLICMLD
jgi:KaiC/GvpD/RAD55 family RecA-like ATPase